MEETKRKIRIYHNPRCRKSRAGLEYLHKKTSDFEIKEYLREGISAIEILQIMDLTHLSPLELIRKQEEVFRKELKGKNFNREEWAEIISLNPKLLQRPVVIVNNEAVLGDPVSNIDKLL